MNSIRKLPNLLMLVLVIAMLSFGCKSNKKAMEASNAAKEKARIEQEALARKQQEEAQKREAEERARREDEAKRMENEVKVATPRARLNEYFTAIATSNNVTAANSTISEALSMFSSADAPVLIVISESGGVKDYDRPTTIKAYLNYLKDQKKSINAISEMKMDTDGKISELELRKN